MTLKEKMKQLRWLTIGSVEKTIESVEDSKYEIKKHSENLSVEQKYFMNIFEEKFPKVLNNISLLGEQLYGIDKESWNFEDLKSPSTYHPGITNWKKGFSFGINYYPLKGWPEDYLKFSFDQSSKELEEIAIKGDEIALPFSPFKAKTINDFCEKYFKLVEKNLNGDYIQNKFNSRFIRPSDLIHLLNKVPEYIERMYNGMEQERRMKLEESNSEVNSLESLEVIDFTY